jgi:hypothetical protein
VHGRENDGRKAKWRGGHTDEVFKSGRGSFPAIAANRIYTNTNRFHRWILSVLLHRRQKINRKVKAKLNKKFWEELIVYFPWYDTGHIENDASNNSSIVSCVFVTVITFLASRCLVTIGGYTYRGTDWWEGFMKYAVEMGSGAVIYTPSLIKMCSGVHKLIWGFTERQHGDLVSLFLFFKNKESRLKKVNTMCLIN